MYKNILIATDGSELSGRAVQHGIALAKQLGAKITVLTVTLPFHIFTIDPQVIEDIGLSTKSVSMKTSRKRLPLLLAWRRPWAWPAKPSAWSTSILTRRSLTPPLPGAVTSSPWLHMDAAAFRPLFSAAKP